MGGRGDGEMGGRGDGGMRGCGDAGMRGKILVVRSLAFTLWEATLRVFTKSWGSSNPVYFQAEQACNFSHNEGMKILLPPTPYSLLPN
jgi:hypothetical protein